MQTYATIGAYFLEFPWIPKENVRHWKHQLTPKVVDTLPTVCLERVGKGHIREGYMISLAWLRSQEGIIFGLCAFLAFLSFKPSEPYLSQYLVCNENTQQDFCSGYGDLSSCNENAPCMWSVTASSCDITPCSNVSHGDCGNSDYSYCEKDGSTCKDAKCYKDFSEDQVNDQIYPWSTYAYLPFLLILGPAAELCSYRAAILVGISGRLVTRFLLLYGNSILEMQLMQVAYAFGTAAEDGKD